MGNSSLRKIVAFFSIQPVITGALIFCLIILGFLPFGLQYKSHLIGEERARTWEKAHHLAVRIETAFSRRIAVIWGLHSFAKTHHNNPERIAWDFTPYASGLYDQVGGVRNLSIAPDNINVYVFPQKSNERILNSDLLEGNANILEALKLARESRGIALSAPHMLAQGGLGFEAFKTVHIDDDYWGVVSVTLNLVPIISEAGLQPDPSVPQGVTFGDMHGEEYAPDENIMKREAYAMLQVTGGKVFWGDAGVLGKDHVKHEIALPGCSWTLVLSPVVPWAELIGKRLSMFWAIAAVLSTLITMIILLLLHRAARLQLAVEDSATALHDEVVQRIQADKELSQSRAFLAQIFAASPDALAVVKLLSREIYDVNPAFMALVQASEAPVGKKISSILGVEKNVCDSIYGKLMEGDSIISDRFEMVTLNGVDKVVAISAVPLLVDNTLFGLVSIRDVTERVRMEKVMVQTEKMMSVGGLAAGMAHEINNPLGGVLQGVQNITRRISPDLPANKIAADNAGCSLESIRAYLFERKIDQFLLGIQDAGQRAARIVANMLEFSRTNETVLSFADVNEIIQMAVGLSESDYDLQKKYDFKSVGITLELEKDLPKVPCITSEIEQVLLNLIKNSVQAMNERKLVADEPFVPTISIRSYGCGEFVCVDIEDNGPGLGEIERKRIFEPFYTTKSPGEGTGLGLSVAYFIVTTNHGGELDVTSKEGRGTCFTIKLPVKNR